MPVFVDTSAMYALLDRRGPEHARASQAWSQLTDELPPLVSTNYVMVEAVALCQRRLGLSAVHELMQVVLQTVTPVWVSQPQHDEAVARLLAANRRELSLVDCVSFAVMDRLGIRRAFTLDEHFRERGFECIP